jgi:hypothetical protein
VLVTHLSVAVIRSTQRTVNRAADSATLTRSSVSRSTASNQARYRRRRMRRTLKAEIFFCCLTTTARYRGRSPTARGRRVRAAASLARLHPARGEATGTPKTNGTAHQNGAGGSRLKNLFARKRS